VYTDAVPRIRNVASSRVEYLHADSSNRDQQRAGMDVLAGRTGSHAAEGHDRPRTQKAAIIDFSPAARSRKADSSRWNSGVSDPVV